MMYKIATNCINFVDYDFKLCYNLKERYIIRKDRIKIGTGRRQV